MSEISTFIKMYLLPFCFFHHVKIQYWSPPEDKATRHHLQSRNQASESASALILEIPTSRTVRNVFQLFINYPDWGISGKAAGVDVDMKDNSQMAN
jgi:hypothetical protein